jgi:Uma2 family endonuclease
MSVPTTIERASIEDLYRSAEKAELINGTLVIMEPTGEDPGYAADEIYVSLREYARRTGFGRAFGDNKGFVVDLPHRKSFSPDAAFYVGPRSGMKFLQGAPLVAIEVRSEGDYGTAAERAMAEKRADYFAAGTVVVWDVDLLSDNKVRVYRSSDPHLPTIYPHGEFAEAEPALPGWRFPVNDLFE